MADTLLNCPFCGGKAEVLEITEGDEVANVGGSVVTCRKCGASSPVHFDRKENLVDSWNQRASLPQNQDIRGLVERLLEMAARFENGLLVPSLEMTQREGRILVAMSRKAAAALSCLAGEGWRPISDAPKDGTHVLIAQRRGNSDKWSVLEGHFVKRSRRSRNGTWYGTGDYGEEEFSQQYEPTHWMPLPAAPSVEEKLP